MRKLSVIALCLLFTGCAAKSSSANWNCKSYGGLLDLGRSCTEVTAAPRAKGVPAAPRQQVMAEPEPADAPIQQAQPVQDTPAPTPVAEKAPEPVEMSVRDQLMAMPPQHYAVQIVSMSTEENLQRFIREHDLFEKAHLRTYAKGQVWYVVLYGVYDGYSEAKRALDSIPYRHQTQAWIRTVGSLQDAVRAYESRN